MLWSLEDECKQQLLHQHHVCLIYLRFSGISHTPHRTSKKHYQSLNRPLPSPSPFSLFLVCAFAELFSLTATEQSASKQNNDKSDSRVLCRKNKNFRILAHTWKVVVPQIFLPEEFFLLRDDDRRSLSEILCISEDWWVSFGTLLLSQAQYLSCVDEKARTSRRNNKCQQSPNAASWSHFWIYMKIYIAFWISIYFKSSFAHNEDNEQDLLSFLGSGRNARRQQLINPFAL